VNKHRTKQLAVSRHIGRILGVGATGAFALLLSVSTAAIANPAEAAGAEASADAAASRTAASAGTAASDVADAGQPEIPVTLVTSANGSYLPTVKVSINGSEPITMMIDAGTSVLVAFPGSIVGANPPITTTDISQGIDYDGSSASGVIATGTVTVGGVTSPQPVAFLDASSCTPHCLGAQDGIQGVIGISQPHYGLSRVKHPEYELYSALAQLSPELSAGYTVDFTAADPVVRLGAPAPAAAGDGATTIQRLSFADQHYPNGQPVFMQPTLCWTISIGTSVVASCNATSLDTGQSTGMLKGSQFEPVITPVNAPPQPGAGNQLLGMVKTGAVVRFATSPTSEPFSGIVEPGTEPFVYGLFTSSNPLYNIGNGFYLNHVVATDNNTGAVVIGAARGIPSAPQSVTAVAGDGSITADWDAPQSAGSSGLSGFVVTIANSTGQTLSTTNVGASARSATIDDLQNGHAYVVSVAAANSHGLGPSMQAPAPVVPGDGQAPAPVVPGEGQAAPGSASDKTASLAQSGSDLAPWLLSGLMALLAGGAWLAVARRRTRVDE
jgi:hypothetical protein